jgi:hypothetical protein
MSRNKLNDKRYPYQWSAGFTVNCYSLSNVYSLGRGDQCMLEGKARVTTGESHSAI